MRIRKMFSTNWHVVIQHKWAFIACSAMTKLPGTAIPIPQLWQPALPKLRWAQTGRMDRKPNPGIVANALLSFGFHAATRTKPAHHQEPETSF